MRFSIKTLIYLAALLSVVLGASRFGWVRWPMATQSFFAGVIVWPLFETVWRGAYRNDLPRNSGQILAFVILGMLLMVVTRITASLLAAIAGLVLCCALSAALRRYGTQILAWIDVTK